MKKSLLLIFLLTEMVCAQGQPTAAEYGALMDLYSSTNGPSWANQTGWATANPNVVQSVVGWYGVQTDVTGHVTVLDLDGIVDFSYYTNSEGYQEYPGNNLVGTIPSTIGGLGWLRILNLGGNHLSGSIPSEIGQLTNLEWLIGSKNLLSGSIPASIGNLSKLDRIMLEENQLTGSIPATFSNLSELWAVLLNNNQLTGSIPPLNYLTKMHYFYLYNNKLTGSIPAGIGSMTLCLGVGLHNNQLTGTIPSSIANLINLHWLYIGNNKLEGPLPVGLASIPTLDQISIDQNRFTFENFVELKSTFTGSLFSYSQQDSVDVKKTYERVVGGTVTFSSGIDRNSNPSSIYQWFKVVNGITTSLDLPSVNGHTHVISELSSEDFLGYYYYVITNPAVPGISLTSRQQNLSNAFSGAINYVRTIEVLVEGKTDEAEILGLTVDGRSTNFTYIDGLGRPIQNVSQQASPSKQDIIQAIVYDQFGRENRKYLPFVSGNDGNFRPTTDIIDASGAYIGVAQPFYSSDNDNGVADDAFPFAESIFEASPLNRVLKQGASGEVWQPNSNPLEDRSIKKVYRANEENEVLLFEDDDATGGISADENGSLQFFEANQLFATVTIDEHQNDVVEYIDKDGRVLAKKVQYGTNGSEKLYACTYYIYDDVGDLVVVLPPEGVKEFLFLFGQQ